MLIFYNTIFNHTLVTECTVYAYELYTFTVVDTVKFMSTTLTTVLTSDLDSAGKTVGH